MALNRYLRIIYIKPELIKLKNLKILDVGCGDGQFTSLLLNEGNEIIAIDISNNIKPVLLSNVNFIIADGNYLPFKKKYFDFIFCSDVFEHVENYQGLIQEMERVINCNGRCLISTVNGMWKSPIHVREYIMKFPICISNFIMGNQFNKADLLLNIDFLGHIHFDITPEILINQVQSKNFHLIRSKYYCGKIGSLIMEIFFSFNFTVRFFIFPVLRILLYFDKMFPKSNYWQYYILMERK